jgi:hypothetical protein
VLSLLQSGLGDAAPKLSRIMRKNAVALIAIALQIFVCA